MNFLPNILLLFFAVLGHRYLKMISIFKFIVSKRTQNYLLRMINKNDENNNAQNVSDVISPKNQNNALGENEGFPNEELNLSSIMNDTQEIDENEIEKDYFESIKSIALQYLNISIVDEM